VSRVTVRALISNTFRNSLTSISTLNLNVKILKVYIVYHIMLCIHYLCKPFPWYTLFFVIWKWYNNYLYIICRAHPKNGSAAKVILLNYKLVYLYIDHRLRLIFLSPSKPGPPSTHPTRKLNTLLKIYNLNCVFEFLCFIGTKYTSKSKITSNIR
jgi:hypothetical protein